VKVLSPSEMRAADAAAIDAGMPSLVLMESAAWGALRVLERDFTNLSSQRIAIFCGKGNNGGDGLALARLLALHHQIRRLDVLLAYPLEDLGPDCAAQLKMLEELGIAYSMRIPHDIAACTIAIDALLGTGARGTPDGTIADWIALINSLPSARRIALDVPSGIGSGNGLEAHATVAFGALKTDLVLPPVCFTAGKVEVVPIGIAAKHFAAATMNLIMPADLRPVLEARDPASHKGTFGHVAVLGGAAGKHGALHLAGAAALRAGAGLVTLFSPDASFRPSLPDLMCGTWSAMHRELEGKRVVAIGPGLGTGDETRQLVEGLFQHWPAPMVLDADALNCLSPLQSPAATLQSRILTPHPGEMARLLGRKIEDRVADSRDLATRANCTVILKGQRTVIAFPTGQVWINPTGSPALAKGGSGDVLTGLIAAYLSQHPREAELAILAAVYLHGRCGELAAEAAHETTSLASELAHWLPAALRELHAV
jgi:ADP-dependent NAD(P)H-hydrate dehydratase / NAD(P)H-hydrate epimerase